MESVAAHELDEFTAKCIVGCFGSLNALITGYSGGEEQGSSPERDLAGLHNNAFPEVTGIARTGSSIAR